MDGRKFLSPDERAHLEAFLIERLDKDLRNSVMFLTAIHSGARATELLNLGWRDINTETGEVFLATLKGGRPRAVVLPKFVRLALERLRMINPDRPFDLSYNRLGELWREYRPRSNKPFHSLRHTFAMHALRRTGNIHFVQRSLGHKNIQNTMVYLDYEYSTNDFKKLMRVR